MCLVQSYVDMWAVRADAKCTLSLSHAGGLTLFPTDNIDNELPDLPDE